MKRLLLSVAAGILSLAILSSTTLADQADAPAKPSPAQVARNVVGTWRYGFFRVEYFPLDGSGKGEVRAAGRTGLYFPTKCGPGGRGNMLLKNGDDEICVFVEFIEGTQIIKFPPRGNYDGREVSLHPVGR